MPNTLLLVPACVKSLFVCGDDLAPFFGCPMFYGSSEHKPFQQLLVLEAVLLSCYELRGCASENFERDHSQLQQ